MRLRFTLDITRTPKLAEHEPEFEHRDNDSAIEPTYGGDPALHRIGFIPAPTGGDD